MPSCLNCLRIELDTYSLFYSFPYYFIGFFDKAKKKILGDRVEEAVSPNGEVKTSGDLSIILSGYDPSWWEDQELGKFISVEKLCILIC